MSSHGAAAATTAVGEAAADRVARWLTGLGVRVRGPLTFEVVPGGRSNLTYRLTDAAGSRWILRRPPLASLHASAHDVLREHRVMAALRPTVVPVPAMVGAEPDAGVIGAPFFVMDFVDGTVLTDQATAESALNVQGRARAGPAFADLLADLHEVDPAAGGLGDPARGAGYLDRQLRRWGGQLDRLDQDGRLTGVLRRLAADPPVQAGVAIVHGDFRPGNMIVGPDGSIRALLDWELCTLGDPLADLGWLLAYWGSGTEVALPLPVPTRAAGFPSRSAILQRYAERSGRAVDDVGYYVAFALWRLAVILAGVHARTRDGGYGDPAGADAGADLAGRIATIVAAAEAETRAAGR